jgi:hypothetical protein
MGKRSKEEYATSYVCVYVHEPQHKTDGREGVREEQILRNKGDSGVGQSESNAEEIWISLVVWRTK